MSEKIDNRKIYLSGGGDENQSSFFDKFFFELLKQDGKLLYIPIALKDNKIYSRVNLWMEKVIKIHKREDLQIETWKRIPELINLNLYDGIYIGGGNTWTLMDDITKSGFKDYLIQYVENGGLLYGGSAGAIILGKRIDTQNDENKINLLQDDGLNLVNEYSIACHFKNDERAKFNEWAQNKKSPIICLPEGSGAILESGNIRCIGVNGCIIYMPEGNEIAINQADFFSVE